MWFNSTMELAFLLLFNHKFIYSIKPVLNLIRFQRLKNFPLQFLRFKPLFRRITLSLTRKLLNWWQFRLRLRFIAYFLQLFYTFPFATMTLKFNSTKITCLTKVLTRPWCFRGELREARGGAYFYVLDAAAIDFSIFLIVLSW